MSEIELRRFYKEAGVMEGADGFGVVLDGKALKTRSGNRFRAPNRALALACAKEWNAQDKIIAPLTMPMTRFVNVAMDVTAHRRAAVIAHIVNYMGTDLVSHRAETPAALAAKQGFAWDPILAWAKAAYNIDPPVVTGIAAADASAAQAIFQAYAEAQDDFALTGLAHAVELAGSAIIGLALMDGELDAERAFQAAALDDLWSLERWGEDAEARGRLERLLTDMQEASLYFSLLGAG